jgi:hypothetical protein
VVNIFYGLIVITAFINIGSHFTIQSVVRQKGFPAKFFFRNFRNIQTGLINFSTIINSEENQNIKRQYKTILYTFIFLSHYVFLAFYYTLLGLGE